MTRHQVLVRLSTALLAAGLLSCGIRGRPLPPLIILPAAVTDLSAVRLGDEVHLEFTVPDANADGSQPPDLSRVDIYAVTTMPEADGEPPVLDEWLETADPIFSFDVVVPVEPEPAVEEPEAGLEEEEEDVPDDDADAAPGEDPAPAPGELLTMVELLTPDVVEPVQIERDDEGDAEEPAADELEAAADEPQLAGPLLSPPLPRLARRTYIAVAVSRRNRQSAVFAAPPVPVRPAPDPPGRPLVTYTETSIDLEWTAPDTARLPVQRPPAVDSETEEGAVTEADDQAEAAATTAAEADNAAAEEMADGRAPAVLESTVLLPPQTPSRYDVYDVSPPAATESDEDEPDAVDGGNPRPLNDEPLAATSHAGVEATLGVERCFVVRTVDTVDPVDGLPLRSEPSETACVLLVDIFPPAAPTGLVAVAGAGAISLTWNANAEEDVAGYMLLRGRAPDGELEPLTPELVASTNYRDTAVEARESYVYAVQAVDGAEPPNVSVASDQVVEQAP